MYKEMLNKGFKPIYYTNDDWFESRTCNTRLFYRYDVNDSTLLNSIFNILDIYGKYYWILEDKDVVIQIETDEEAQEFWLYFYNTGLENYEIPKDKLQELFNIIPNAFEFEHSDN